LRGKREEEKELLLFSSEKRCDPFSEEKRRKKSAWNCRPKRKEKEKGKGFNLLGVLFTLAKKKKKVGQNLAGGEGRGKEMRQS